MESYIALQVCRPPARLDRSGRWKRKAEPRIPPCYAGFSFGVYTARRDFFCNTGTVNINDIYGSISFYNTGDAGPLKAFLYDNAIQGITM